MPWIFLGAIALIIVLLIVNWAARANKTALRRIVRLVSAGLMVLAAIWLMTRGAFAAAGILFVSALALFSGKMIPNLSGGRKTAGQQSQVETEFLRVTRDHDTGRMDGVVLSGRVAGKRLSELTRTALTDLFEQLQVDDPEGARLLDAYLSRAFEGDWESENAANADYGGGGEMTREEAYEILGLHPGAKPDDIKEAHRRLMKKFHPDQGGSTYFASRINQAKDMLLKA